MPLAQADFKIKQLQLTLIRVSHTVDKTRVSELRPLLRGLQVSAPSGSAPLSWSRATDLHCWHGSSVMQMVIQFFIFLFFYMHAHMRKKDMNSRTMNLCTRSGKHGSWRPYCCQLAQCTILNPTDDAKINNVAPIYQGKWRFHIEGTILGACVLPDWTAW